MNNYRKALAVLVLVLAFSSSAFADDGIIHTDVAPPPPPSADGIIHTGDAASTNLATDGIIQTGLVETLTVVGSSLLRDALTLF